MRIHILAISFLATSVFSEKLDAQDGGQLYGLYCSACHAPDGKGATGGAFPPLAGSEWLIGDGRRSISIVLKGIRGPLVVLDRAYNLEMPPQEAVLDDKTIAAILTYVRSSWGNQYEGVTPELVKTIRAEHAGKKEPWTAPEVLKLYQIPVPPSPLENLISRVYKGQWRTIPDFDKIQSENVEEEQDGLLKLTVTNLTENFAIVWEGDFMAEKDGKHQFLVDADDSVRIFINGSRLMEIKGEGGMGERSRRRGVELKKGPNHMRVEYLQTKGEMGLSVGWKTRGMPSIRWLTVRPESTAKNWPDIILAPEDNRTVAFRSFIAGTSPRALGFGFPGGVNLAYSADNLAPELIWNGKFMNAGRAWTNRGIGSEPPAGERVIRLTTERFLPEEAEFKGYTLDPSGNPTFKIQLGEAMLTDSWKAGENGTLVRVLDLQNATSPLAIPLGDGNVTGMTSVTLESGKPATVSYNLN